MAKQPNILLIGPLAKNASELGGATRSFAMLAEHFNQSCTGISVFDTQRFRSIRRILPVLSGLVQSVRKSDIVFLNVSQNGIRFLGPLVYFIARPRGKKIVIRPFGGAFKDIYTNANPLMKWLFRITIFKADIFYLQTELLIQHFKPLIRNLKQLPTSRSATGVDQQKKSNSYQKRFLFVSHIKASKGIVQLLEAIEQLDSTFTVDLYGPIVEDDLNHIKNHPSYKGMLSEDEVLPTMTKYDVLLLPTFYEGEGYPGTILEAYSVGLPVITTNWKAIPEIVEHNKTGLLIAPKSTDELVVAMQTINANNYSLLSQNALAYFREKFEAETVLNAVLIDLQNLANR